MAELQNVSGLKELAAALSELPKRIGKNVLRGATNAGASVFRNEARALAPTYTGEVGRGHPPPGTLKKAIYQKQIREKSGEQKQTFYIGVRHGKSAKTVKSKTMIGGVKDTQAVKVDAFYAHFVEFGTVKMAAKPFMRPAFDNGAAGAIEAARAYLEKRLPEEAAKLKK